MAFLFLTDDVVASHASRTSLVRSMRLEYDEVSGEVTHVAVGPEDGMHEVGGGKTRAGDGTKRADEGPRRLPWSVVESLCHERHAALHGFSKRSREKGRKRARPSAEATPAKRKRPTGFRPRRR